MCFLSLSQYIYNYTLIFPFDSSVGPVFLRNLALFTPVMLRGYWECSGLKNQWVSAHPFIQAFLHLVITSGMQNGAKHIWTEKLGKRVWNRTFCFAVLSLGMYSKRHCLIIADLGDPFPERIPKSNLLRGSGESAAQHSDNLLLLFIAGPRLLPAALWSGCHSTTMVTYPDYLEPSR